jgi:hypothetical protein
MVDVPVRQASMAHLGAVTSVCRCAARCRR